MNVQLLVPPPVEPVTLQEVYAHLRLDPTRTEVPDSDPVEYTYAHVDDPMLASMIQASRERCEQITRRAFVLQTLTGTLREFPAHTYPWRYGVYTEGSYRTWRGGFELPRPPFISLVSLDYYPSTWDPLADPAEDPTDVLPEDFVLDATGMLARVRFVADFVPPKTYDRADAFTVTWEAGYKPLVVTPGVEADPEADPPVEEVPPVLDYRANIPAGIKQAILLGVQLLYDELATDKRQALENAMQSLLASHRVAKF